MASYLSAELAKASRTGITVQLAHLKGSLSNNVLLPANNKMPIDSVSFLRDFVNGNLPVSPIPATPYPEMIGQYIAISTFLHCYDAYSYLSSSWNQALLGNASVAVHLGYYSELRSTMSLLACEGIGVFNDDHWITTSTGSSLQILVPNNTKKMKTHAFCWAAYDWWTTATHVKPTLDLVTVDSQPLSSWLSYFPSGHALSTTTKTYLDSIGLDIETLSKSDQTARGKASYRPNALEGVSLRNIADDLTLFGSVGENFIGANGPRDSHLGILILCALLRQSFEVNTGIQPQNDIARFHVGVRSMISKMSPNVSVRALIEKFCLSNPLPVIPILSHALERSPNSFEGVLCRASLLCFHSVLHARQLLTEAGVDEDDLMFWWRSSLEARGAIAGGQVVNCQDVVDDAFEAHNQFLEIGGSTDRKALWENCASIITDACRYERLAVAGLFA